MKNVGLFLFSFVLAISLLLAGPGTAKAVPLAASETIVAGASTTSIGGSVYTAAERNSSWTLLGNDAAGNQIGATVLITSGIITLDNAANTATFTGNVGLTPFSVTGTVSNFGTTAIGDVHYYSWLLQFGDISALSNAEFGLVGPYSGSLSVQQTLAHPITGLSAVSLDVSNVPLPPSILLFAPGLIGLAVLRKRHNTN